jgi:hypothetical protein
MRRNSEYDHQTAHYQSSRHQTNYQYAPARCRELASYDVVLRFEVSVKPNEEYQYSYCDEGRAEWLSDVP